MPCFPPAPRRPVGRALALIVLVGGLAGASSACFPDPPGESFAYERCVGDEGADCADGTSCLSTACCFGSMCTQPCANADACPPVEGFDVACETFTSGRRCVVVCKAADACPGELECQHLTKENGEAVSLCI